MFNRNKKEIDHYTMQMLTGDGIFNKYRRKVKNDAELRCWDYGDTEDDAEHVLHVYLKRISKRTELENLVGEGRSAGNVVENILR